SKRPRSVYVSPLLNVVTKPVKVGRLLNVSRLGIPFINIPSAARNLVPEGILFCEIAVKSSKSFRIECGTHQTANLFHARPDVSQINIYPVGAGSQWLFAEIDIYSPGD